MTFVAHAPRCITSIPGTQSRELAARLARVECRDTTYLADDFPVFWDRASGANVWDVDGNCYVDLTSAFGVSSLGHAHPTLLAALRLQSEKLVSGLGDVHPTALKVRLAERLAARAPGDLGVSLFGSSGFEAVEAALKTAALLTGRPGAVAFEGGYHGLGYGSLALTWRPDFRQPFLRQLNPHVVHLPFPHRRAAPERDASRVLDMLDRHLAGASGDVVGAVVVEPVQGRGGVRFPQAGFLAGLREICTRRGRVLVLDEILTGLGRLGSWFACEREGIVPDLLCLGKSLGGGLPLSVCMGSSAVMSAWGISRGDARHTSTFLGQPLACATALATLDVLESENWPERIAIRATRLESVLAGLRQLRGVTDVRGEGFLWAIELETAAGAPDANRTFEVVRASLAEGVLVLADGSDHNVLTLLPPFCIDDEQIDAAVEVLRCALDRPLPADGSRA